ncbi:aldo/keto reductase [Salinicoccus albus]|uniref:aldo/keto reductase n=1 Tax=Salinicoccus albus TaxID=418756 RepID=UPI00036141AC|nr:aldo/keto reductase [Salinicoccus albus]
MNIPEFELNDGTSLPAIGFGTVQLKGYSGALTIAEAIRNGYRFIDTAYNYENEGAVGKAIELSGLRRNELYIESKLPGRYHSYDDAMTALQESLLRANLEYFDLYIIHWPNPNEGKYIEAWRALIEAQKLGLVKTIGVSNFLPQHIDHLVAKTGVRPAVNQIEMHPRFNQAVQREYHDKEGILTTAWSPLGRARYLAEFDEMQDMAKKYDVNIGQLILRWHYQHGVVTIPRSSNAARQSGNLNIFDFEITREDMEAVDGLSVPGGRIDGLDPAVYEEF